LVLIRPSSPPRLDQLIEVYALTPYLLGRTVSSALWGTIAGAVTGGYPGERIGRRDRLRIMALFYLSCALGRAFARSWGSLLAFRIIGGVASGVLRCLRPCILRRFHPRSGAAVWSDFSEIKHRRRHSPCLSVELLDWPNELGPGGVANGNWASRRFRRCCFSSFCFSYRAVRAGWRSRIAPVEAPYGQQRSRAGARRNHAFHLEGTSAAEPLLDRKYGLPIFSRRHRRRLQIN
jgi:hypothetical protein